MNWLKRQPVLQWNNKKEIKKCLRVGRERERKEGRERGGGGGSAPGGEGLLNRVLYGESRLEVQPLTPLCTIFERKAFHVSR